MAMTETHFKVKSSEETARLYRQKYEAQIREWNARSNELQVSTPGRLGESPTRSEDAHKRYETMKLRLRALAEAADDTWDELEGKAEQAWVDFKDSIEGAYDALKSHSKN